MTSKKLNLRPLSDRLVVEPQEKDGEDGQRYYSA